MVCLVQHGQDHGDSTGCECVDEVETPQAQCEHMPRIKPCRKEPSEGSPQTDFSILPEALLTDSCCQTC